MKIEPGKKKHLPGALKKKKGDPGVPDYCM